MASASVSTLSSSGKSSSPQTKAFKKAFSSKQRSAEQQSDGGTRSSIDSLTLEKSPTLQSTKSSPSRDGSNKSGSGVRKLIPGHAKRQRKKLRDDEMKAASLEEERGRSVEAVPAVASVTANKSNTSLLTDTDVETPPPLVSRDSHSGYFTTSSPLISSKTINDNRTRGSDDSAIEPNTPTTEFPSIVEPDDVPLEKPTPKLTSTPTLPAPGLVDRADTLQVDSGNERRNSISRLRGKSPARKVRDIFTRSSKSPRSSPERDPVMSPKMNDSASSNSPDPTDAAASTVPTIGKRPPAIETDIPLPRTPPSTLAETPLTTVTPPTPTENLKETIPPSGPEKKPHADSSGIITSPSGNMISHRRVRSASSATHSKSKLSTSMIAPLTPAIEELNSPAEKSAGPRNVTPGGGFFSSWVSAAQNAASTLTNLTSQNRTRSSTANSDPVQNKETETNQSDTHADDHTEHKQLAIETLGSGDLNFGHLGLENGADEKSRPSLASLRKNSDLNRDEQQAKVEDMLAKRAVSAAYEKINDVTPVAEIPDPIGSLKHAQTIDTLSTGGVSTTPNGSIFEAETGPVKRSNSVRSKIANRRSRGSSIATGHSTLGGLIGASTATLVSPATVPKPSAFTLAPKARNRGYHQQFRSVPEDDSLIEDYSCALQKEILLAGRIYISEGHICFSSNILGWVTTLIISFEEIVSVERENTAMIIPNAIAIQTLHARHTFRSLLSREATFELMISIWKANHPASFQKSVNGKQLVAEQTKDVTASVVAPTDNASQGSDNESVNDSADNDEEDEDEYEGSAPSIMGSSASLAGSEMLDAKSITRKVSAVNGGPLTTTTPQNNANNQTTTSVPGASSGPVDYPGPVSHAPTECTDATTHYDKIIKDEIIQAPLGKIYSLLYGPQSGAWVRKYLTDECKCTDLALEDDKKGLTNENKSRQYSYTKPLNAPIGPKSTKCITSENLDFFDLERAVSVTCTTQTPNVPSGSSFSTKTRYCLTWAPGNATRLQMNCTIEWTAKSWLKGTIENGANEGQQQYGDGLIKALKATLGRSRATTVGSKSIKNKKKKKGEKKVKSTKAEDQTDTVKNWGIFEPVRPSLEPVMSIVKPVARMDVVVTILAIMVLTLWFGKTGQRGDLRFSGPFSNQAERLVAYEELWHKQESELWDWLESRAGVDKVMLGNRVTNDRDPDSRRKQQAKSRRKQLKGDDMVARMRAEKWTEREVQDAVRVTREKLDHMEQVLEKEIRGREADETI